VVGSLEGLLILVLTLPGFLGYLCFSRLYEGCIEDVFEKVGIVVALNVTSLILVQLVIEVLPAALVDIQQKLTLSGTTTFASRSLIVLSVVSVLIGGVFAAACNSKTISRGLLSIGLTRKSNSRSVLADVIRSHPDCFLKFNFKEGGYVLGHPLYYSLDGEECIIFLEKAAIRPKASETKGKASARRVVQGPGVMLMNFDSVQHVELL
jgi:hypothetical protein